MKRSHQFPFGIALAALTLLVTCWFLFNHIAAAPSARAEQLEKTAGKVAPSSASSDINLCLAGCPAGMPPDDVIVTHHILVLANNPHTKFADWVAYQITLDSIGTHCIRRWERDPAINASDTLEPRDYVGIRNALRSDRGHQAPLASLCGSPFWQEADYLSNITPQKTNLNEGAWEHLERAERALVSSAGAVYSVTGPLYERPMPSLPKSRHSEIVPSAYWKVIAVTRQSEILITAFIMDQDSPRDTNYCSDVVSVSEVERRAHLVFMSKMAEVERVAIETGGGVVALNRAIGCQ